MAVMLVQVLLVLSCVYLNRQMDTFARARMASQLVTMGQVASVSSVFLLEGGVATTHD